MNLIDTSLSALSPSAIILAQGEYPESPAVKKFLYDSPNLIICDGASKHLLTDTALDPKLIVGDGDSIPAEIMRKYGELFVQIADQETNDLTKAVTCCKERGWKEVMIVGATGLREDHTIANIFLLEEYRRMGMTICMVSDYGSFFPIIGDITFKVRPKQQISLFPLTEEPFSTKGLLYEIEEQGFSALWQASLNESVGEEFVIRSSHPVIVYVANEVKD
ncbi:thiamine diphosphokinase [Porphyromonas sp. COT-108 OH2963]|uniref:thiamine diphosphokinase n=1 Tax=Porphyromonas sp. COT-108 OH2963 TaxID=1515614 RepID=UPI0006918371|nr:thiamine diphosphokinase [Porphyromonas sp. COT-108 OH2963]